MFGSYNRFTSSVDKAEVYNFECILVDKYIQ